MSVTTYAGNAVLQLRTTVACRPTVPASFFNNAEVKACTKLCWLPPWPSDRSRRRCPNYLVRRCATVGDRTRQESPDQERAERRPTRPARAAENVRCRIEGSEGRRQ